MIRRKSARVEGVAKLEIRQVIGLTAGNGNGLASSPSNEDVAYAAGCVVVVYNAASNTQTSFYTSPKASKAIASVAYSHSGKFLAGGEVGYQPAVLIWDTASKACVAELKAHRYGVACVTFSPQEKHLVSIGAPHDGQICIWDWTNATLLAKTRAAPAAAPITTLAFASDGGFFATGGVKHVKFWQVGSFANLRLKSGSGAGLESKPVALGAQKEADFVSLAPAPAGSANKPPDEGTTIYGVTAPGILCLLRGGKALEKWVDLKVTSAFALRVSKQYCACACAGGVVRLFSVNTLTYVATLPKPVAVRQQLGGGDAQLGGAEAFPDALGCSFIGKSKLAVIYSDHSLYIWDISNISSIKLHRCFQGHGGCIWDAASLPQTAPTVPGERTPGLATCSADGSIRLWTVGERPGDGAPVGGELVPGCRELLGAYLLDAPSTSASPDSVRPAGFRSLAVRPDGRHVAAGDRNGNLRVYDVTTGQLVSFQEAHDSEILTLSYSENGTTNGIGNGTGVADKAGLLASGGRDRLVHLYDVSRNYDVIETLDDHSASITAVRFASDGSKLLSCSADKSIVFRTLTPGPQGVKASRYHQEVASRGTLYDLDVDPGDKLVVTAGQEKRLTLYSLATGKPVRSIRPESDAGEPIKVKIDPGGFSLLCSHTDKSIRIFNAQSGDLLAKGTGHSEVITGLVLSPSCSQLISVSGDSCVFVWQLPSDLAAAIRRKAAAFARPSAPPLPPSLMPAAAKPPNPANPQKPPISQTLQTLQTLQTPSESVAAAAATDGMSVEASFSFSIPKPDANESRFDNDFGRSGEGVLQRSNQPGERNALESESTAMDFKMSVSRLPSWAQPKGAVGAAAGARGARRPVHVPGDSRWAQRLGQEGYRLFSEGGEDGPRPEGATVRASGFGAVRKFTPEKSPGPALLESFCEEEGASAAVRRHSSDDASWETRVSGDDVSEARGGGRGARRASEGTGPGVTGGMDDGDSSANGIDDGGSKENENEEETFEEGSKGENENGEGFGAPDGAYSSDSDFEADASPRTSETGDGNDSEEKIKRVDRVTPSDVGNGREGDVAARGDESDGSDRRNHAGGLEGIDERNGLNGPEERNGSAERNRMKGPHERNGVNGPEERNAVNGPEGGVVWDDDDAVELGEEMEDSPRTDLFADHFDSLKRQTPVDTSRQSLSARFFARLSLSPNPPSSPPQNDPPESPSAGVSIDVSADDDASLTSERARLKSRGREGRMAAEVARLRERMSGLGIAILPRAPTGARDPSVTSPPVAVTSLSDAETDRFGPPVASRADSSAESESLETKTPEKSSGVETGGLEKPVNEAWLVSDRTGRAVPRPAVVHSLFPTNGENPAFSVVEEGDIKRDVSAASFATTQAESAGGAEGLAGREAVTTDNSEGLEANPEKAALEFPRRLSPWASHTNPLFDRGDTPPGAAAQSKPTAAPAQNLNPESTAETARTLFGNDEKKELRSEAERSDVADGRVGHVSESDTGHVAHFHGSATPPPQRSQSPDLDHERAHRTEPPNEPLILDHTTRNAAQRTESARFLSPSLAEGIPTVGTTHNTDRDSSPGLLSELSFPLSDQPEKLQTPQELAALGGEEIDSVKDVDTLRRVEVSGGSRTPEPRTGGQSPGGVGGAKLGSGFVKEINENRGAEEWEGGSEFRYLEQIGMAGTPERSAEPSSAEGHPAENLTVERRFQVERTATHSSNLAVTGGADEPTKWHRSDGGDSFGRTERTAADSSASEESCSSRETGVSEGKPFLPQEEQPGARTTGLNGDEVAGTRRDDPVISPERRTTDGASDRAVRMPPGNESGANRPATEGVIAPSSFPAAPPLPPLPVTESVELPRPTQEYQAALRALVDAADRASLLFEELKAFKAQNVGPLPRFGGDTRENGDAGAGGEAGQVADISALTQSYQEFVPSAVRKLQRMMQDTSAPVATDVTRALATSERPSVSGVNAPESDDTAPSRDGVSGGASKTRAGNGNAESMLASVDVEAVLERYSEKYSERLAQQLLALMSKSLQGGQRSC